MQRWYSTQTINNLRIVLNFRFSDQHFRLSDFDREIWVVCPNCQKRAIATVSREKKEARLSCSHCGQTNQTSTLVTYGNNKQMDVTLAAHQYFNLTLWYQHPFKNEVFWAYNPGHLLYLEQYIGAKLREHKDRTHFTLLEKLPKFYHEAKNREALLKIIQKLKSK